MKKAIARPVADKKKIIEWSAIGENHIGPVGIYCFANVQCNDWVHYLLAIIKEVFLTMNLWAGVSSGNSVHRWPLKGWHDSRFVIHAMVAIDAGLRIGQHRRRMRNR